MSSFNHRVSPVYTRDGKVGVGEVYHGKVAVSNLFFINRTNQMKHARIPKHPSLVISRREIAVVTQFETSTVRSDNPEQGMIVPVNGLETALNNVANMMANIMERLDKALPGPSGTRDIPDGQPRQVLRTASSPILQELHDPKERDGRSASQVLVRSLRNLEEDEVQSQARVPAPWRLGPPVPEAGEFQDLRQQIQEMQKKINKGRVFTTRMNTPLASEIFAEPYPQGFKMPFVKRYDGESDPQEHINSYVQVMITVDASDALMCRCFLQTVDSKVADWVNHVLAGSIRTWDELGLRFLEHFAGNCRPKKHFTHLASVRQKHGESLKNFLIRWRKESREVEGTDDKSRLAMFTAAFQDGLLHTDLTTHPPDTFEEAMVRAGRYVTLEERKEEKKEKTPKEEEKTGNKKPFKNKKQGFLDGPKGASPGTSEKHKSANPVFTLPVAEVMAHAAQQGLMTYLTYSQKVCNVEDTGKWCAYHRKNDHNTEDCYTLKNEMARLIRRGHLKKFVQDGDTGNPGNAQNGKRRYKEVAQAEAREKRHIGLEDEEEDSEPALHRQKRHHGCNFIIGGNTGGDSATSRKKWANAAMVNKVLVPEGKKLKTEPIVFSNADLPETGVPHRDALVITIDIMDLLIHKTLVDTGSSVNIMYMDTYKALGLTRDELSPIKTPLTGFTGDSIESEGVITLPVEIGDTKATRKLDMEFVVVGIIFNTNIILGRPGLEDLECVISPRHLSIKFPTPHGVGIARGSQRVSRAWYLKATKQPVKYDTQVGEVTAQLLRAEEKRPRVEVASDIEEVELEPGTPGRLVRIGKGLGAELRSRVISVLRRFRRVFAWSPADMPGLDHKIAVHRLNVLPDAKPVKQKRRHLSQERRDFVNKEVATLQSIGHIRKVQYPDWPRPSIKGQALADFQVECTAREMTRAQVETRVEKDWWVMNIDGSSGSRSCGAGIVLITPEKFRIYYAIRFQFRVSNNEAEYEALINGLKILSKMGVSRVQVYSDFRLVVGQITGEFEAKEERMKRYRDLSLEMLRRFEFKLEHIPRAQNAEADVLSKLSAESPEYISKLATVEELVTPSLNSSEVIWVSADPLEWLDRLAKCIEDGEALEDPQEARLLRMRAPTYKVQDGVLYKRSYNGVLLRCLRAAEAKALMEEIHEGVCAAHQGPYSISRRAIIQGYFWPTMRKDCEEYLRKCPTCQQFQNIPGRPATNYTPISSVIPFSGWGTCGDHRKADDRLRRNQYTLQVDVHTTVEGRENPGRKASYQRSTGKLLNEDCVSSVDGMCQDSRKKLPSWLRLEACRNPGKYPQVPVGEVEGDSPPWVREKSPIVQRQEKAQKRAQVLGPQVKGMPTKKNQKKNRK
ncbi:unnamed protein product [Cuscuta campestris]|uniref:RNase H type-1 domain-containing protein n=1 Tax=Cuscuta campestris TaxID=132261 RepID=A0A484N9Y6_9ASTE|nr:unnamed protein product [Cuscuta campestris]